MTSTVPVDISRLRDAMTGAVILPGDDLYDDARRVWNADIDRRPAVIAQCETAPDVSAAVQFAATHALEIAVRGGAHNAAGLAVVDDGLMIDLSKMNGITIDPATRRARCGGGALLADVVAAAQEHGLGYPLGVVGHTGVGGLTLGGGMGWLTRKHGLSIDNLLSAQVVTADGSVLRTDERQHPDLFWALRGGGGNFGVVTEFEFVLHPVGPMVQFALLFYPLEHGRQFLRMCRDVVSSLPPDTNVIFGGLNAPPAPFVPPQHQLQPGYAAIVVGFGSEAEHDGVAARMRRTLPPLFEFVTPMPYLALQTMLDDANAWGMHYYEKGCYLEELTDGAIDVLVEHTPRKNSPLSLMLFYRLDAAYSQVADDATAFSGSRSPRFALFTIAVCPAPELLESDRAWVRELQEALRPHAVDATYVNSLTVADEAQVRTAYGPEKYERLVQIKRKYDPQNLFRRNANINPSTGLPRQRTIDVTTPGVVSST